MIKVGIIGAELPDAGELLRILVNHPEVEIKTLYSPEFSGRQISSCHHGFIGEDSICFTERIDPASLDILFIADNSAIGKEIIARNEEWPSLRIVDLSPDRLENSDANGMEYGLSEINRKAMVRGARLAVVPSPIAAVALISLYPLASHLLLSSDIDITVVMPEACEKHVNKRLVASEIEKILTRTQTSFSGKVNIKTVASDFSRAVRMRIDLKCPLGIAEIDDVFESVYDDHNFVFTTFSPVDNMEVEGTQKCIVSFLKKDASSLELESVGDCFLRGGAGDATHILNLFFALDEKVGLSLKPSGFGTHSVANDVQTSWFA